MRCHFVKCFKTYFQCCCHFVQCPMTQYSAVLHVQDFHFVKYYPIRYSAVSHDFILFNTLRYLTVLFYVGRRKTRPCPGWVMEEDDVVACILPDDCPPQVGLTIVIIKGFNFQDRLTDQEKQSMIKARFYRHSLLGFPSIKIIYLQFSV